jgi:O-antigen/teichoic acid export membrane protein
MSASPSQHLKAAQSRFAANIRWQLVANGSQALLGGLYIIMLGRFLGPADFGTFSTITAAISVAGLTLELRLQEVVARDYCHIDDGPAFGASHAMELVDLIAIELLTRLLPATLVCLLIPWITRISGLAHGSRYLLAVAGTAFVLSKSGNSVSNGLLRVLGRTDLIACCMAIDWGSRLAATVALGLTGTLTIPAALWSALVASSLGNALQVGLACTAFQNRVAPLPWSSWRPNGALRRMRSKVRLMGANLGVSCTDLMAKDLDILLISGSLGPANVGIYKMAKSIVQTLWRAVDPFYLAILPEIQRLWQLHQWDDLRWLLRKTSARLLILALMLVTFAYLGLRIFGHAALGRDFIRVPSLTLIMSMWILVCAPVIWGIPLAIAVNRPELSTAGSFLGLLVGLISFLSLTPSLGLVGSALAWNATLIVGFAFTAGMAIRIARRQAANQ